MESARSSRCLKPSESVVEVLLLLFELLLFLWSNGLMEGKRLLFPICEKVNRYDTVKKHSITAFKMK